MLPAAIVETMRHSIVECGGTVKVGIKEDDKAMTAIRRRRPGRANNEHQEETDLRAMTSTRRS